MSRARARPHRALLDLPAGKPLLKTEDHGPGVRVEAATIGASGDRWVEPFLEANRAHLHRLGVEPTIEARGGVAVRLNPGPRIGAVPLLSPATRRVVAGLLITPRFRWSALGAVLSAIGFQTEPSVGGSPQVPGSAREVPTWLLAAPVIGRLERLLDHLKRGFIEREEERSSPRGRVDWSAWARAHLPRGRWTKLPCRFPDPAEDPELLAAVRWTLGRIEDDLAPLREANAARALRARIADMRERVGSGAARRPAIGEAPTSSAWIAEAVQAMGWIAEERGLGGSRSLDGLSWDLRVDEVWEAWVSAFIADLAPRAGLLALPRGETRRDLRWRTPITSMRALAPDTGLRGADHVIWVDAKYKSHLQEIARKGWSGISESLRDAHRADLHQALAYASLADSARVDSLLVYPELSPSPPTAAAIATVTSGRRHVRLMLLGLPFGFRSPEHRGATLSKWREALTAH